MGFKQQREAMKKCNASEYEKNTNKGTHYYDNKLFFIYPEYKKQNE